MPCPRSSAISPAAPASGRWSTPSSRRPTSPPPTSPPRSGPHSVPSTAASPTRWTATAWLPASTPPFARHSVPWSATSACATWRPAIGSTSCTSSCRWWAATNPPPSLTVAAIAEVVERTLPADDVLVGYHEQLRSPVLQQSVRGYLSGSIDIVLRTGGRYVVVDHKSNWLGVEGEELSAWHYRPEAMRDAMVRAHYPLQAMLYAAALHRYLRWRQPGYDPELHLGGVLYLFLRGMTGEGTPPRRRPALRRVRVAAAGRPRHRPLRRARPWQSHGEPSPMSAMAPAVDPFRPERAHAATGLLAPFTDATVLDAADVHVGRTLVRLGRARSEPHDTGSDLVALAIAFAVRAVRLGSVTVDLATIAGTATVDEGAEVDLSALPWPDAGRWVDAVAGSRSSRWATTPPTPTTRARPDRCACSDLGSPSIATGATNGPSSPICCGAPPHPIPSSTTRSWRTRCGRIFAGRGTGPDAQQLAAGDRRPTAVLRHRRRPRHRQDHHGGGRARPPPRPGAPRGPAGAGRVGSSHGQGRRPTHRSRTRRSGDARRR